MKSPSVFISYFILFLSSISSACLPGGGFMVSFHLQGQLASSFRNNGMVSRGDICFNPRSAVIPCPFPRPSTIPPADRPSVSPQLHQWGHQKVRTYTHPLIELKVCLIKLVAPWCREYFSKMLLLFSQYSETKTLEWVFAPAIPEFFFHCVLN